MKTDNKIEIGNTVSVLHKGVIRSGFVIDIDNDEQVAKIKWIDRKPKEWNQWFRFDDLTIIH